MFGAPRALGIARRPAGLAQGGRDGLALLGDSATMLEGSPALLERAHSLAELGAARRRSGELAAARDPLAQGPRRAARCSVRVLRQEAPDFLGALIANGPPVPRESEPAALRRFLRRRPVVSSSLRTEVMRAPLSGGHDAAAAGRNVLARLDLVRISIGVLDDAAPPLATDLRSLDAIHLATARRPSEQ